MWKDRFLHLNVFSSSTLTAGSFVVNQLKLAKAVHLFNCITDGEDVSALSYCPNLSLHIELKSHLFTLFFNLSSKGL